MIKKIEFLENMLGSLAQSVGWQCEGPPLFGWHEKSVGKKAVNSQGKRAWVKLMLNPSEKEIDGERAARGFSFKPNLLASYRFEDTILFVMDYIQEPTLGQNPWTINHSNSISNSFLSSLKQNLSKLHQISTLRVHSRFDLVKRRLSERWGFVLHEADCQWETVHGDLHWANLTESYILDWDSWGIGLVGLDEATLLAFSGLYPDVVEKIYKILCVDIPQKSFSLAILFITAELLRMHDLYGDHPELVSSLKTLGESSKNLSIASKWFVGGIV